MDNSQIVRKRLVDLKKLSEELKESSEHEELPNINIIQAIMSLTKDYYPSSNSTPKNKSLTPNSGNNSTSKLFAMLDFNNKKANEKD